VSGRRVSNPQHPAWKADLFVGFVNRAKRIEPAFSPVFIGLRALRPIPNVTRRLSASRFVVGQFAVGPRRREKDPPRLSDGSLLLYRALG
jgi:hypothetical protein